MCHRTNRKKGSSKILFKKKMMKMMMKMKKSPNYMVSQGNTKHIKD